MFQIPIQCIYDWSMVKTILKNRWLMVCAYIDDFKFIVSKSSDGQWQTTIQLYILRCWSARSATPDISSLSATVIQWEIAFHAVNSLICCVSEESNPYLTIEPPAYHCTGLIV